MKTGTQTERERDRWKREWETDKNDREDDKNYDKIKKYKHKKIMLKSSRTNKTRDEGRQAEAGELGTRE
jgi:hypothetical protein